MNGRSLSGTWTWLARAGAAGGVLSVGALLIPRQHVPDLLSSFPVQYAVLLAAALAVALSVGERLAAVVLALCLAMHVAIVIESTRAPPSLPAAGGAVLRVMTSNLLMSNEGYAAHVEHVRSVAPDLIVFEEYTPAWHRVLSRSLDGYAYRVSVPLEGPSGMALYSRLPLADARSTISAASGRPNVEASVSAGEGTLRVIGAHPPAPISGESYRRRNAQLRELARTARALDTPTVILGDLNVTPWSAHFRELVRVGRLVDGRRGVGVLPTWPASLPPLRIPIDHVLVSGGARVVAMAASDGLPSDHRSLWADVRLP